MGRGRIDTELLLDCAFTHKAAWIREFLSDAGLAKSGTRDDLRERLRGYIDGSIARCRGLTEFLNRISGWGNQHLYLYNAPPSMLPEWRTKDFVLSTLRRNGAVSLLNKSRPLVLPDEPTLASVSWTPHNIRFVWNEKRVWYERREDEDEEEGEMIKRAWERKTGRGTLAFDWDLTTGAAMVMIQRLPSGTRYTIVRDRIAESVHPFVDLRMFELVRVSQAIKPLLESGEVRERKTNWETKSGGKAGFSSVGKHFSVKDDDTLKRMHDQGGDDLRGSMGVMYWIPNGSDLESELSTVIDRKDQRLAIRGERREKEVRHVVGCVRRYCR